MDRYHLQGPQIQHLILRVLCRLQQSVTPQTNKTDHRRLVQVNSRHPWNCSVRTAVVVCCTEVQGQCLRESCINILSKRPVPLQSVLCKCTLRSGHTGILTLCPYQNKITTIQRQTVKGRMFTHVFMEQSRTW